MHGPRCLRLRRRLLLRKASGDFIFRQHHLFLLSRCFSCFFYRFAVFRLYNLDGTNTANMIMATEES